MRSKVIVKASLTRLIEFADEQAYKDYIDFLYSRKKVYKVLERQYLDKGGVRLLIKEQYNNTELL